MTHPEIRAEVRALLCQTLCCDDDELDDDTLLADHGLSSIDLLDVVAKLESRYGVRFVPASMVGLTPGSLARNVASLLAPA